MHTQLRCAPRALRFVFEVGLVQAKQAERANLCYADIRDSDIDVMIEPAPGSRVRLSQLIDLREQLEALFDRDVDLAIASLMTDGMLRRALNEGVTLYERSGS